MTGEKSSPSQQISEKKVALITGASSGIGRATAIHFSTIGYSLVITGRNKENLQLTEDKCRSNGAEVLSVIADLTVDGDVERLMSEAMQRFSRLNVLINNAGMAIGGSIEETTLKEFDLTMSTNVRSMFYLTHLAVPHLIARKGSIINVSGANGIRAFPDALSYSMSLSAIDQFTRCTALDLAPKQVRVNSVNPGVIETNLHKGSAGFSEAEYNEFLEHCKTTHPLGRHGQPDEVAKAIAFLASDNASFTTGVQLPVDGARSVMCLKSFVRYQNRPGNSLESTQSPTITPHQG